MRESADQNSILSKCNLTIRDYKLIDEGDLVVVAMSGGPDSIVLTEILLRLKDKLKFTLEVCHYNHGIRGTAGDEDEKFVIKYCKERNLALQVGRRGLNEEIKNEDDARELRYKFFEKVLIKKGRGNTKIATAHHMDDLAETYIMRLIRGSGIKGLSSILPRRKNFIRPLLSISKNEILDFLEIHHLSFCTDLTNFEDIYFRNQIRNSLIPMLKSYNPQVVKRLAETAESTSEVYAYMQRVAEKLFESRVKEEDGRYVVDAREFSSLAPAEKTYLVIMCIDKLGGKDYTFAQVKKIVQLIERNIGKKILPLPHSLRFELKSGKIYIYKQQQVTIKENDGKPKKK